ncbi:NAD(P)H-binding protein [Pseudoxanthomonas suwonensis]|uniref:NmrA family NAD(P)-binding protein n=1 Tax=Pseudoxanthomonas suwonensis TaxID=314722 RepID=UPI001B87ED6B|nr:NAD(P)H-binding protein [Pseudoxanthomonas suwonensis]
MTGGLGMGMARVAEAAAGTGAGAAGAGGGRIVVTTPTGNIGGKVLAQLLAAGAKVRVVVRDGSRLPEAVRGKVEVVQGSHSDPAVVDQAFRDVESVFWVCPPDPRADSVMSAYLDFTRPACAALRRHGVRRVVAVSALGRGTPMAANAGFVTASLAMCDLIEATGVALRALAMPSFMDNIARQAAAIREQGAFYLAIDGDRRMPSVATRDIAAVASGLLLDRRWNDSREVPVLGPEDLSSNDMARIMGEVLGRPVHYRQVPLEAYRAGFVQRGMSEAMAQGMTDMARAKNEGLDNAVPRTAEHSTPTTFRQWCGEELRPLVVA